MGTNYSLQTWRQPTFTNSSQFANYGLQFNGVQDYLVAKTELNFIQQTCVFSIAFWLKFDEYDADTSQTIMGTSYTSGQPGFQIRFDNRTSSGFNNTFAMIVGGGSTPFINTTSSNPNPFDEVVADNDWHHYTVTSDGTTCRLYIDGTIQPNSVSVNPGAAGSSFHSCALGSQGGSQAPNFLFGGAMAEVCVFNYALSPNQVAYLNLLGNPMVISGAEPICYWSLGGNSIVGENDFAQFLEGEYFSAPNISQGAGSVYQIDGSNSQYGILGSVQKLKVSNASKYTMSIWYNAEGAVNSQGGVIGYNFANPNGGGFYVWKNSNAIRVQFGTTTGTQINYLYANAPNITQVGFQHITVIFDGTEAVVEDRLKVYLNGELLTAADPQVTISGAANLPTTLPSGVTGDDNRNMLIGMLQSGTNPDAGFTLPFTGQLSNAYCWNEALTAAEALALYNNGQPLDIKNEIPKYSNLQGWWELGNGNVLIIPAVTTFPWAAFQEGVPYVRFSNDHAKIVSGSFEVRDIDSYNSRSPVTASINLTFPTVLGAREDIEVEVNCSADNDGSINASEGGTRVIWEYSIDGGAFTQFALAASTSSTVDNLNAVYSIPDTTSSLVVRAKMITSNDSACRAIVNSATLTDSTGTVWSENFSTSSANAGWNPKTINNDTQPAPIPQNNNQYGEYLNAPPVTVITPATLILNDSRSPDPKSFTFNGDTQYFSTDPSVNSIDIEGDFTFSAWVRPLDIDRTRMILSINPTSTTDDLYFYIQNDGRLTFNDNPNGPNQKTSNGYITKGVWQQVAVTRSSGVIRFYKNGGNEITTSGPGGTADVSGYIEIGRKSPPNIVSGLKTQFLGGIADVQIWDIALSASQIEDVYNLGTPLSIPVQQNNLQRWYKMSVDADWDSVNSVWAVEDSANPGSNELGSVGMTLNNKVFRNVSDRNALGINSDSSTIVPSDLARNLPSSLYSLEIEDGSTRKIYQTNNDIGDALGDAYTGELTFSMWVKWPDFPSSYDGGFFNIGTLNSDYGEIGFYYWDSDGGYNISLGDGDYKLTINNPGFTAGRWYHIAYTVSLDESTDAFYIDGSLHTDVTVETGSIPSQLDFAEKFATIGAYYQATYGFDAFVSNVSLFKAQLNADKIKVLYNGGIPTNLKEFSVEPFAWWPCDGKRTYIDFQGLNQDPNVITRDVMNKYDATGNNQTSTSSMRGFAPFPDQILGGDEQANIQAPSTAEFKADNIVSYIKNNINNAYSVNMSDYGSPNDINVDPADSGRTTNVP